MSIDDKTYIVLLERIFYVKLLLEQKVVLNEIDVFKRFLRSISHTTLLIIKSSEENYDNIYMIRTLKPIFEILEKINIEEIKKDLKPSAENFKEFLKETISVMTKFLDLVDVIFEKDLPDLFYEDKRDASKQIQQLINKGIDQEDQEYQNNFNQIINKISADSHDGLVGTSENVFKDFYSGINKGKNSQFTEYHEIMERKKENAKKISDNLDSLYESEEEDNKKILKNIHLIKIELDKNSGIVPKEIVNTVFFKSLISILDSIDDSKAKTKKLMSLFKTSDLDNNDNFYSIIIFLSENTLKIDEVKMLSYTLAKSISFRKKSKDYRYLMFILISLIIETKIRLYTVDHVKLILSRFLQNKKLIYPFILDAISGNLPKIELLKDPEFTKVLPDSLIVLSSLVDSDYFMDLADLIKSMILLPEGELIQEACQKLSNTLYINMLIVSFLSEINDFVAVSILKNGDYSTIESSYDIFRGVLDLWLCPDSSILAKYFFKNKYRNEVLILLFGKNDFPEDEESLRDDLDYSLILSNIPDEYFTEDFVFLYKELLKNPNFHLKINNEDVKLRLRTFMVMSMISLINIEVLESAVIEKYIEKLIYMDNDYLL